MPHYFSARRLQAKAESLQLGKANKQNKRLSLCSSSPQSLLSGAPERCCGESPVHRCATAVPCGHHFDLGCMLAKCQSSLACSECNIPIRQLVRNRALDNLAETFKKTYPEAPRAVLQLEGGMIRLQNPSSSSFSIRAFRARMFPILFKETLLSDCCSALAIFIPLCSSSPLSSFQKGGSCDKGLQPLGIKLNPTGTRPEAT